MNNGNNELDNLSLITCDTNNTQARVTIKLRVLIRIEKGRRALEGNKV